MERPRPVFELQGPPDFGPYMHLADTALRLFSVFDDLRYDRSDADILTPAMRRHGIDKLAGLGFTQTSGTVLQHREADVRCLIPKFHRSGPLRSTSPDIRVGASRTITC